MLPLVGTVRLVVCLFFLSNDFRFWVQFLT
jgi:hypothetical protein